MSTDGHSQEIAEMEPDDRLSPPARTRPRSPAPRRPASQTTPAEHRRACQSPG